MCGEMGKEELRRREIHIHNLLVLDVIDLACLSSSSSLVRFRRFLLSKSFCLFTRSDVVLQERFAPLVHFGVRLITAKSVGQGGFGVFGTSFAEEPEREVAMTPVFIG